MNDYPKDACSAGNALGRSQAIQQQRQLHPASQQPAPQLTPRESELPEQLRRLENAVDLLGVPVAELAAHLAPVLQPEATTNSATAPSAPSPVTGYATMVYTQVLRLEHLYRRLQDILHRSEA